ncbi:MAG: ATP-binding protein [Prevotellaceae bacterium]|nr:ATP-binding protein [Candidatus Colivivens equi]MCQ2076678.1 ATP-binding protein [Bacteroidaceae bacterium]
MEKRFDPIQNKTADIIEYMMQSPDIPEDVSLNFKIRLCIEEAVENIVSYAYENGQGYVVVGTKIENNRLILSFRDEGVPFNPLDKPDPDITSSAEERPVGGLGIFICKQMMDKVTYVYEHHCNNLQMEMILNK